MVSMPHVVEKLMGKADPTVLVVFQVLLIRLTSFPILLTIRFFELHSFRSGISLTAEKGKSVLSRMPIINTSLDAWHGKSGLDIIEAVFDYQPHLSSSDEDESEHDGDDEGAGKAGPDQGEDQGEEEEEEEEEEDRGASWDERAARKFERDVSRPARERERDEATRAAGKSRRGDETPAPRRRSREPRGLGSLSSPLAKLFGRTQDPREQAEAVAHNTFGHGERAQDESEPVSRDEVSEVRHLLDKMHEMEARNKRIEVRLLGNRLFGS